MQRDLIISQCAAVGCDGNAQGRVFCVNCAHRLPVVLHKTLRFLFNHGKVRAGYEEALENAKLQLRQGGHPWDC